MEITTDIPLKGRDWDSAINQLGSIFANRTNYSIYVLCLSIGIMYDKRIEKMPDDGYEHSVPRNVIQNNDNGKMDYFFEAAILSTTTETFTEDERLELAFGDKHDFNKIAFLTQFANYGVTKLATLIGKDPLESMDNIRNFIVATAEGNNFELDELPDDILVEE